MAKQLCRRVKVIPSCKSGDTRLECTVGRGDTWTGMRSGIFWRSLHSHVLASLSIYLNFQVWWLFLGSQQFPRASSKS